MEWRKLWPFKIKGVKNSENKSSNATKVDSQTPTKFLVCCFVAIRIQN
jgi:hypothetical protein